MNSTEPNWGDLWIPISRREFKREPRIWPRPGPVPEHIATKRAAKIRKQGDAILRARAGQGR